MVSPASKRKINHEVILEPKDLQSLLDALKSRGYATIGPKIRDGAVLYEQIQSILDLPVGWHDEQDAGAYGLSKNDTGSVFEYVVGPGSLKRYFHPPLLRLWQIKRKDECFQVIEDKSRPPKYALIGVRSCDIHALQTLDKVFNTGEFSDPIYNERRRNALIVAVNCTRPGGTCFCNSMNTGPEAKSGFDIVLTEVLHNGRHYFIAAAGSKEGQGVLDRIACRKAGEEERRLTRRLLDDASRQMGRTINTTNLKSIFYEKFEHPHWEKITERCLTCGNCTMVCPTCFCNTIEDTNSLDGEYAERWRKWDSCFNREFSYMHGGSIRRSEKSRYRQWLTHKMATWMDQFGTFGCVGCGRCITWCPVGIDITEEAKAILE
ncbi:MAG: 4Fe-4S dicluster domain-containing protein [Pseudomonadota bacterium]